MLFSLTFWTISSAIIHLHSQPLHSVLSLTPDPQVRFSGRPLECECSQKQLRRLVTPTPARSHVWASDLQITRFLPRLSFSNLCILSWTYGHPKPCFHSPLTQPSHPFSHHFPSCPSFIPPFRFPPLQPARSFDLLPPLYPSWRYSELELRLQIKIWPWYGSPNLQWLPIAKEQDSVLWI